MGKEEVSNQEDGKIPTERQDKKNSRLLGTPVEKKKDSEGRRKKERVGPSNIYQRT